jgi:hypothetical protein
MAQEDNLLAAQLAVSATRDSSAMKVLAVITAIFLPGTYIATLFSMSMFNWQGGQGSTNTSTNDTSVDPSTNQVVMPYIWIYWLISVVLTALVIVGWRTWWLNEDSKFQKKLPKAFRTTEQNNGSGVEQGRKHILEKYLKKGVWKRTFDTSQV